MGLQYDVAKICDEAEPLLFEAVKGLAGQQSEVRPPEGQFREMWKRRIAILIREKLVKTGSLSPDDLLGILEDTAVTYYRAQLDQELVRRTVRPHLDHRRLSEILERNSRP